MINLTSLNLHSNRISRIDDSLNYLSRLRDLNLSSNEIEIMEGLDALSSLRVLNLSSNKIRRVGGLAQLHCLQRLILSYNRITSLEGFSLLRADSCQLEFVDLRGNRVSSLAELSHLSSCSKCLREVIFQLNGKDNPICAAPAYASTVIYVLPALFSLDGVSLTAEDHPSVQTAGPSSMVPPTSSPAPMSKPPLRKPSPSEPIEVMDSSSVPLVQLPLSRRRHSPPAPPAMPLSSSDQSQAQPPPPPPPPSSLLGCSCSMFFSPSTTSSSVTIAAGAVLCPSANTKTMASATN
mmetsp:Transcript_35659/g.57701  ORF Transcript_35659/g.57701 Transcript_35659/m.57701 type:complete len:293 (-) Transcript_35659:684-1562(-)